MRVQRILSITTAVFLLGLGSSAWAQIQSTDDLPRPTPKVQAPGAITPFFWVGAQAVESFGYNFETKTYGFNYNTNDTWASINVAFVDSHYDTPKLYEVGNDPDIWTGHVKILNYTMKLDTYSSGNIDVNKPSWLAEIQGHGYHFGLFTQAGKYVETTSSSNNPSPKLEGGNLVLFFPDPDAEGSDYLDDVSPITTSYTNQTGAGYAGYVKDDLFNVYLSAASEGNYEDSTETEGNGMAYALDFHVTPFGEDASEEHMITPGITGNAIGGVMYGEGNNPIGFGLKSDCDIWLGGIHDDWVLTPIAAFDGKLLDPNYRRLNWEVGGGLLFAFSGKRWVTDSWDELNETSSGNTGFADYTYESNKILKYAYAQVYATYSEWSDVDLAIKIEEPDGIAGFDENLGFMAEFRYNNIANLADDEWKLQRGWSAVGRVSYDLQNHTIVPYVRSYYNSDNLCKLRVGVQAGIIAHTGFEIAYTSKNLNPACTVSDDQSLGRLEFIVCIKTDSGTIMTPKDMSDWDYSTN